MEKQEIQELKKQDDKLTKKIFPIATTNKAQIKL